VLAASLSRACTYACRRQLEPLLSAAKAFMPQTSLGLSRFAFTFIRRKVVALRPHPSQGAKRLRPLAIPQRPGEI